MQFLNWTFLRDFQTLWKIMYFQIPIDLLSKNTLWVKAAFETSNKCIVLKCSFRSFGNKESLQIGTSVQSFFSRELRQEAPKK